MPDQAHSKTARRLWALLAAIVLAAAGLAAPTVAHAAFTNEPTTVAAATDVTSAATGTADADGDYCLPESLFLYNDNPVDPGYPRDSLCIYSPVESIYPAFPMTRAHNGSQWAWCVFTQPRYTGAYLRIPPFSRVEAAMSVASANKC